MKIKSVIIIIIITGRWRRCEKGFPKGDIWETGIERSEHSFKMREWSTCYWTWRAEDWVDGTRSVEGEGRGSVEWKPTPQGHKQRVRNVVEIHRRNSQNFGRNIVTVVYNNWFRRLSAGRSVGGSTDSPAHSNESFYRLLELYLDQKRDVPPTREPSNGRSL